MAILNTIKPSGFSELDGTFIGKIHTAAINAGGYSTESASFVSALSTGNLDEASFESAISAVAAAAGLDDKGRSNNMANLQQAAILMAAKGSAKAYQNLLENPVSMEGSHDGFATSYGPQYESFESFDNQAVDQWMNYSIGLAYTTGQQSPGLEKIYRTIALTPEQGGVDVEVPLLFTTNTLQHGADGSPSDWGFRRVIDSSIDDTILRDNSTKIIPTHNTATAGLFMATSDVTPWPQKDGSRTVTTSALKTGKEINLLGLGNLDTVSKTGNADYTEALDRNIGLEKLFVSLGGDTLAFKVLGVPFTRFTKAVEKNGKRQELNTPITSLIIDGSTTNYSGDDLTGSVFTAIKDAGYKVRLKTNVSGHVDTERGVIQVMGGGVEVVSIVDSNGVLVDMTTGAGEAIKTGLAGLTVGGYTVDSYLTNSNHRFLGLMLNIRNVKERLQTRTRSPIFVPYPVNEERDQSTLDHLTYAVLQQKEADGIKQLITYHERLMEITGGMRGEMTVGDFEENTMPIEGIGRYLINPYVQTVQVNLLEAQSLDTVAAVKNGQEVLLNAARSVWFDILQHTNYDNACRYIDGGQITRPYQAVFMTTDKLKRFMTLSGDSRTLGADVPFNVYSTVNKRLSQIDGDMDKDAMYMVLVREGDGVDPLTAGVMLSTPSLVSTLTTTRNNRHVKELVYQPRYAHYNLCPIIVKFEVSGVDTLLNDTIPFKTCEQCVTEVVVPEEPAPAPAPDAGGDSGSGTP